LDRSQAAVFYVPKDWHQRSPTLTITITALAAGGLSSLVAESVESMPLTKLLAARLGQHLNPPNVLPFVCWGAPSDHEFFYVPTGYSSGAAAFAVCSPPVSAGALEAADTSVFEQLQPVEQFDERFRSLLNNLEATVSPAGSAIASRVKALVEAAQEEEEVFSMDALNAFAVFARLHPQMPYPHITLGPKGGVLAEWRQSKERAVGIYFSTTTNVRFTITRQNPVHVGQIERFAGLTSVDRVGEVISQNSPFAMTWISA
jgi:hypothetical protein